MSGPGVKRNGDASSLFIKKSACETRSGRGCGWWAI